MGSSSLWVEANFRVIVQQEWSNSYRICKQQVQETVWGGHHPSCFISHAGLRAVEVCLLIEQGMASYQIERGEHDWAWVQG